MTAHELLLLLEVDCRYELVRGELHHSSFGWTIAGIIAGALATRLGRFVEERGLGITGLRAGFLLATQPDTIRAPSLWFVASEHAQAGLPDGYWPGAPDLAIDVISPSHGVLDPLWRAHDVLATGARLAWILDPVRPAAAAVFRQGDTFPTMLDEDGVLDGGDVIPGFAVTVRDLLP